MDDQISLAEQVRYWERWQTTTSDAAWHKIRSARILQLLAELELPPNITILDNGCGTGWFTLQLANLGQRTVGIDLTDLAERLNGGIRDDVEFIHDDFFRHRFSERYDLVVCQQVISHLHVHDQPEFVRRNAGLLKANGYLVLTGNQKRIMQNLGSFKLPSHRTDGHYENWLSHREVAALLAPLFKIRRYRTVVPMGNAGVLRLINSPKLAAVCRRFVGSDGWTAIKEWMGFGLFYIVVAQKTT